MQNEGKLDRLISDALSDLALDPLVSHWKAKEKEWVSYFAFKHLIRHCRPGSLFFSPAQLVIEGAVPRPQSVGFRNTVRRDLLIWPNEGMTCWEESEDGRWKAECHPLAVLEWKVHRLGHPNPLVEKERNWLKEYCGTFPVAGYAIEVRLDRDPKTISCFRFFGKRSNEPWLELQMRPTQCNR
jgi:hypothetical protein